MRCFLFLFLFFCSSLCYGYLPEQDTYENLHFGKSFINENNYTPPENIVRKNDISLLRKKEERLAEYKRLMLRFNTFKRDDIFQRPAFQLSILGGATGMFSAFSSDLNIERGDGSFAPIKYESNVLLSNLAINSQANIVISLGKLAFLHLRADVDLNTDIFSVNNVIGGGTVNGDFNLNNDFYISGQAIIGFDVKFFGNRLQHRLSFLTGIYGNVLKQNSFLSSVSSSFLSFETSPLLDQVVADISDKFLPGMLNNFSVSGMMGLRTSFFSNKYNTTIIDYIFIGGLTLYNITDNFSSTNGGNFGLLINLEHTVNLSKYFGFVFGGMLEAVFLIYNNELPSLNYGSLGISTITPIVRARLHVGFKISL